MADPPAMVWALLGGWWFGVLTRVEEVGGVPTVGLSSDAAWLGVALLAGSPARGALTLTAANAGWYAWILVLQPELDPAAVAGSPVRWFVLGLAGGAVMGWLGERGWWVPAGVLLVFASTLEPLLL